MAKSLRAKIPPEDELVVQDINSNASSRFVQEVLASKRTHVADSVEEVADRAVRTVCAVTLLSCLMMSLFYQ